MKEGREEGPAQKCTSNRLKIRYVIVESTHELSTFFRVTKLVWVYESSEDRKKSDKQLLNSM